MIILTENDIFSSSTVRIGFSKMGGTNVGEHISPFSFKKSIRIERGKKAENLHFHFCLLNSKNGTVRGSKKEVSGNERPIQRENNFFQKSKQ